MGEMRKAYKIVTGKPEGERPPETHLRRWNSNVSKEGPAEAIVNTIMNNQNP
jgi:hypothetical protein